MKRPMSGTFIVPTRSAMAPSDVRTCRTDVFCMANAQRLWTSVFSSSPSHVVHAAFAYMPAPNEAQCKVGPCESRFATVEAAGQNVRAYGACSALFP